MAHALLQSYRRKRNFRQTPEPKGAAITPAFKGRFVIQKHAARQRHYDLRLELDNTLKSWAVPKGPSLNPNDKRLAVQVEDHPIEYATFEGVIPKNQYGAGAVMVWDAGKWVAADANPQAAYEKGHLHFTLNGSKIHGGWSLVRMHGKDVDAKNWLLIKIDDEYAANLDAEDLDDHSVVSRRSLEQIALERDKSWSAEQGRAGAGNQPHLRRIPRKGEKAPLPDFIPPQLATLVAKPPDGDRWLHEIKYDGYRIFSRVDHGHVTLISRNGKDWSARFPSVVTAIKNLGLATAWLDGEVCYVLADGRTSFQGLQNAIETNDDASLAYFVFDLLYENGKDLSHLALQTRKQLLSELLNKAGDTGPLRFADHLRGQGETFYRQVCGANLEGVISKRADGQHLDGRGREWLKSKCLHRQEFIIGGYTRPRGKRTGFAALLLGVYEGSRFIYTGKVGTGFDGEALQQISQRLSSLRIDSSPYDKSPQREIVRAVCWVKPKLVAEIEFKEWTRDGYLRQPSFKGLREDKAAARVVREQPHSVNSSTQKHAVAGVSLSNPQKALYPAEGISKLELARYYESVAERMLPYVVNRPLTLLRCPDGYTKECFFQKRDVDDSPKALRRVTVMEKDVPMQYLTIQSKAGLIALVQMGVLEIHTWGARADQGQRPDQLVFDLDPDERVPWKKIILGAQTLHDLLGEVGLRSFAKATGGKGLHVVVPIARRHSWPEVKSFAKAVADLMVQFNHSLYTARIAKQARTEKIYIDYVRNSEGATTIAPYSTRAREGAPVALPLSWKELETLPAPNYFTVRNLAARIEQLTDDPWKGFFDTRQSITKSIKKRLGID